MRKNEVEMVLEKTLMFWRSKLKENITLVEIYDLAHRIWREIIEEYGYEEEDYQECYVTREDIDELEAEGELELVAECGETIFLMLKKEIAESITLESGKKLLWLNKEANF